MSVTIVSLISFSLVNKKKKCTNWIYKIANFFRWLWNLYYCDPTSLVTNSRIDSIKIGRIWPSKLWNHWASLCHSNVVQSNRWARLVVLKPEWRELQRLIGFELLCDRKLAVERTTFFSCFSRPCCASFDERLLERISEVCREGSNPGDSLIRHRRSWVARWHIEKEREQRRSISAFWSPFPYVPSMLPFV